MKKVASSESGEKYAQIKHCLQEKRVQYSSKQICGGSWCETTTGDGLFTIQKALLWIMDSQTCSFWTQLISCYLMDWSGVDYLWIIVMFLSAVWTLILTAPIHCRGCIGERVMEFYISSNLFPWTNKLIYISDGLRVNTFFSTFSFFKVFLWNYGYVQNVFFSFSKSSNF